MKIEIQKKDNAGFSLIEIIITLAITSIIVLALYSFIIAGSNNYKSNNENTALQQEISQTTKMMGEHIKEGQSKNTRIVEYDSDRIILHTGNKDTNKVFMYDVSDKSLYVFDENKYTDIELILLSDLSLKKGLLSSSVTEFNVTYPGTTTTTSTDADGNTVNVVASGTTSAEVTNISDGTNFYEISTYKPIDTSKNVVVEVKMTFKVKNKTGKSDLSYELRN